MQRWTPDFIPKLAAASIDAEHADQILTLSNPRAMECSRNLAHQDGIFVGISPGATLAAALEVAEGAAEGGSILAMLPDTGERYLTTALFENIETEMSAEERELSASTPSCKIEAG